MPRNRQSHVTHSAEETRALAAQVAATLEPGAVLCLHGDLGAGKTCFVQGVAQGLGIRRSVGSPTFTLINEYRGRLPLAHIDLYRVRGAADAFGLGLEDYLSHYDGIVAIEWAERVAELLVGPLDRHAVGRAVGLALHARRVADIGYTKRARANLTARARSGC